MKRRDQSDWSYMAERVSQIGEATLKNIHENVKATPVLKGLQGKVYCRTIEACPWKLLWDVRHKKRRAKRRYLLCTNPETCNQQSWEKAIYYDIPK